MKTLRWLVIGWFAVVLSACGTTQKDRGLSGAGIGATAGAVVGAVTGLSVLQGALIGAAAGGITGVATDDSQINLGQPLWKGSTDPRSQVAVAHSNSMVTDIQTGLSKLGYYSGQVDGLTGPKTAQAIRAYQGDHGLQVDGRTALAAQIRGEAGKL